MEQTQAATRRLAESTRREVTGLWAAHQAGRISRSGFKARAAAAVARANTAGVSLADLGLSQEISRHLREPVPPLGLVPNDVQVDQDRMARDIDRIIERQDDPEAELGEWAASENLLTVATAVQDGMRRRGIGGWVRQLSGISCPMCINLADGVVRSVEVEMARHLGCDCIQSPVF